MEFLHHSVKWNQWELTTMIEQNIPSRREIWVSMLLYPRHTLPTAFAPALIAGGLAFQDGIFQPVALLYAFMAGWLIQVGGVITDNYINLIHHPDDKEHERFVMGLNAGVITLRKLRASIYFCYLAALTFGILLTRIGGLPIILIGATSILASLAYSTKPYPLGDHALGEPLFFIFFGPVSLIGCYFVQALAAGTPFNMTLPITLCAISIGALITNILVIDNIRDLDFDRAKNEITIAVLIGCKWSFAEYILLTASAYVIPFLLWVVEGFNVFILLTYLSLPYAFTVTQRLLRSKTFEDRIPLTPQAGQVLLLYSFLLTLGICLR